MTWVPMKEAAKQVQRYADAHGSLRDTGIRAEVLLDELSVKHGKTWWVQDTWVLEAKYLIECEPFGGEPRASPLPLAAMSQAGWVHLGSLIALGADPEYALWARLLKKYAKRRGVVHAVRWDDRSAVLPAACGARGRALLGLPAIVTCENCQVAEVEHALR